MRVGVIVVLLALALGAGGLGFVYAGLADVAATSPHWPLTEWVLSTAMERAVARRAERIEPPSFLDDDDLVRDGAAAFDALCAPCHGAPGVEPAPVGKGLNPAPPDLAREAARWTAGELFWITRHGVRMTGMPAFGPTHSDEEIWQVVGFMERLGALSPARYRELAGARRGADHGHEHP